MVYSRRPHRQDYALSRSRAIRCVTAVALVLTLLAPLALPALSASSFGETPPRSDVNSATDKWPPLAWYEGDLSSLSLVDLALLANDLYPSSENRAQLEASLAVLEDEELYQEEHRELARVVLQGLAQARWHQVQAMRDLSDEQLQLVASADPDASLPEGWDEVMATVRHEEIKNALLALESASTRALMIFESLKDDPVKHTLAERLSKETGTPLPGVFPTLPADDSTIDATATLIEQASSGKMNPEDALILRDSLAQMPPEARGALHVIFEGLLPFAFGTPTDPGHALVDLGAAVDAAEDTLKIWSTATMANQIHHVRTGPGIQIPDADIERPPLHLGVPRLRSTDAQLPPPPSLTEATRELAIALGDFEIARTANERASPVIQLLTDDEEDAVAQMLSQAARYIEANQRANQVNPPVGFIQDPDILETWAGFLDNGLPNPGSREAHEMLATREYLKAQLEAILAREDLMTAIQEAVLILTPEPVSQSGQNTSPLQPHMPASSPTQEAGIDCPVEGIVTDLRPYLAIEPCGTDTEWNWAEHGAVFVIDVGGNDTYKGPFASAPFDHDDFTLPFLLEEVDEIPISVHLDLGGSDTYNATGFDCALGAACGARNSGPVAGTGTYDGGIPMVGVLVDWQSDEADDENRFISGNESQGFARSHPLRDGSFFQNNLNGALGTGLLIERVGKDSRLNSTYAAGDFAQGTIENKTAIGALVRLIGSGSESSARFTAGDYAQGAANHEQALFSASPGIGVGTLINTAGAGSVSKNEYNAGAYVQGAFDMIVDGICCVDVIGVPAVALFADIVGSGGSGDGEYVAENFARGYGAGGYFFDLMLPETVKQEGILEVTSEPEMVPQGPLPPDLDDPSFPDADETRSPGATMNVESTGVHTSNSDVFRLTGAGDLLAHGFGHGSLYLNLGGNNTYEGYPGQCGNEESPTDFTGPANDCVWRQSVSEGSTGDIPTGIDTRALDDDDGDLFPYFLEDLLGTSDENPDDVHPTGRRVVVDAGSRYPFLNGTHAFVLSLTGDNTYGTGFSAGVLLDLGGNNKHFGRTATATGALTETNNDTFPSAAQNFLSFTLDLDGNDVYKTETPGSLGFGAGYATGILFDLGGNDLYHGTAYTQGVGTDGGIGVLADLSVTDESEVNRFRADGEPSQGHGAQGGVGVLVADGGHNTFEDGEREITLRDLWDQLRRDIPVLNEEVEPDSPDQFEEQMEAIEEILGSQGISREVENLMSSLQELRDMLEGPSQELLDAFEMVVFDEIIGGSEVDSVTAPGGVGQSGEDGGAGVSLNMGDNEGPEIVKWTVRDDLRDEEWVGEDENVPPPGFLQAGVPYTFTATVEDPNDDRLEVCWKFGRGEEDQDVRCRFSEGNGTVELEYTWLQVHTDGRIPELKSHRSYWFEVSVEGPGGKWMAVKTNASVMNNPLEINGDLLGPRIVGVGQTVAYQLPFSVQGRDDLPENPEDTFVRVVWGDDTNEFSAIGVDWAQQELGSRVVMPTAIPETEDGRPRTNPNVQGLSNMIGSNGQSTIVTQVQSGADTLDHAPATFFVSFQEPRSVRQISLNASLGDNSNGPVRLGLEGVRADGSLLLLNEGLHGSPGVVRLEEEFNETMWDLEDFPDLQGIIVRQIDTDPEIRREFQIQTVSARGPGAIMEGGWSRPTTFELDYTVVDRYGGRNGTHPPVEITVASAPTEPGNGDGGSGGSPPGGAAEPDVPVRLVDIGNRGPLKETSLIMRTSYPFILDLQGLSEGDELCIEWGDGFDTECNEVGAGGLDPDGTWSESYTWLDSGVYRVNVTHTSVDGAEQRLPLTTVHIEQGIDLFIPDDDSGPIPILFMTFDPTRDTWHEGLDYPAIVDAGGNDRYFGRVAASVPDPVYADIPVPGQNDDDDEIRGDQFQMGVPGVPIPGLLLNAGGDDLYVSTSTRTQAYATHFGVALHLDAGGDDTYVAAGDAQAASERGGIAALVSLGGNNRFNPVPADHSMALGASATNLDPVPHELFRIDRHIGNGPNFVQGATEDGLAILFTEGTPLGSTGFFHAGARAQGFGAHTPEAGSIDYYTLPSTLADCADQFSLDPSDLALDPLFLTCLFGINNVRDPTSESDFYTDTNPLEPSQELDSDMDLWCTPPPAGGSQLVDPPFVVCPSAYPDTRRLSQFFAEGPRYSPGLGALVNSGGPAFYHAGMGAQGTAQPDARGLLLNHKGPSALLGNSQSQAYSDAGLAGTMLGDASVLRLGQQGQAYLETLDDGRGPESVTLNDGLVNPGASPTEILRAAVLWTVNRDERCDTNCGGDLLDSIDNDPLGLLEQRVFNLNIPAPIAPGVNVETVGEEREYYDINDRVNLNVEIDDMTDSGFGHNLTAFAIAYPAGQKNGAGGWDCSGAPLAAPALVGQGHDVAEFELDLAKLIAGTDPKFPAGCTEVHVFARSSVENGVQLGTVWGHGSASVLLLPPPRFDLDFFDDVESHGEAVAITIPMFEPLAKESLSTELRIVPENEESPIFENQLQGDILNFLWEPEDGLEPGNFTAQARFKWDFQTDTAPISDWFSLKQIAFDPLVPTDLELGPRVPSGVEPAPLENPLRVVAEGVIRLDGTATGWQQDPVFRLVDVDKANPGARIRPLTQDGQCATGQNEVSPGQGIAGWISGPPTTTQSWAIELCLPTRMHAGPGDVFNVQYQLPESDDDWVDLRNSTGEVQQVRFVGDPSVTGIVSSSGAGGSKSSGMTDDPVEMCVFIGHDGTPVDPGSVFVTVLAMGPEDHIEVIPVVPAHHECPEFPSDEDMDRTDVFSYRWNEQTEPLSEGVDYNVYAMVRDGTGGLFDYNPGFFFPIDRTDPQISNPSASLPRMNIPDPTNETMRNVVKTAVKPGDTIQVSAQAIDPNLQLVEAVAGELRQPMAQDDNRYQGSLEVPERPGDEGALDDEGRFRVAASATDRAGNQASIDVIAPQFFGEPFEMVGAPEVEERSESVRLEWTLDRSLDLVDPGTGMISILQDEAGEHNISIARPMAVPGLDHNYTVTFDELDNNTPYQVVLIMWDGAGWELSPDPIHLQTLPLPKGTQVKISTDPEPTYSGEVVIRGTVTAGTADVTADLEIHVADSGAVDDAGSSHPSFEVLQGDRRDFELVWNTRDKVPDGFGAQDIDLEVRFSDGNRFWSDVITLRVDNTPPQNMFLDVVGPEPNRGWYNGTILVGVAFEDETPPFTRFIDVPGVTDGPVEQDTVTLVDDGVYAVRFTVHDGAIPPNVGHLEGTIRLDRTLPQLNVTLGLNYPWTNENEVPVVVDAFDDVSGLDGVRARAGDLPWSRWSDDMPTSITLQGLDDGEHWVEVEARDEAHNVRRESFTVVYDRTPPVLVDARWMGWTDESDPRPVVHIVARDELDGNGRPSGMDAIRFAPTPDGPWTKWHSMGTSGTFPINETRGGTVWLQMRDRATNIADPVRLEVPTTGPSDAHEEELPLEVPASALLRDISFAPEEGGPSTPFTFFVRVHPLQQALPARVSLHIAGEIHAMEPEGPALQGGAKIYSTTISLPLTQLESPHVFTVSAVYADQEYKVESSERTGPTVFRLGADPVTTQQEKEIGQEFPVPAVPPLVIGLVLITVLAWRRKSMLPLSPSWRSDP